jgi:hypothetical protein
MYFYFTVGNRVFLPDRCMKLGFCNMLILFKNFFRKGLAVEMLKDDNEHVKTGWVLVWL